MQRRSWSPGQHNWEWETLQYRFGLRDNRKHMTVRGHTASLYNLPKPSLSKWCSGLVTYITWGCIIGRLGRVARDPFINLRAGHSNSRDWLTERQQQPFLRVQKTTTKKLLHKTCHNSITWSERLECFHGDRFSQADVYVWTGSEGVAMRCQ